MSNAVSERWTPATDGRVLAALCVAAFLASLNFFATTPFYAPMARDLRTTIPLLGQVVTLAGTFVAGGRLGAVSPRMSVAVSSVAAGLLIGPMLWLPNVWIVLPLLLLVSVAASMCSVAVSALLAAESPAGAGTTMVLNGSVLNLGTAGGAVLGGALIAFGGYAALGIGLPLFALVAAALAWWPGSREVDSPI